MNSTTSDATLNILRLFDTHGAFIARVIERLTGRGPHVDDLLQETFIIAFQKAHQFDKTRAEPSSWLYGIAANLCRRFRRSRERSSRFLGRFVHHMETEADSNGPEKDMIREEDIQIVRSAIDKLPFKQREVFVLFELEGMDGKDIGKLLNIKENTVWTRLHYARKTFTSSIRKKVF